MPIAAFCSGAPRRTRPPRHTHPMNDARTVNVLQAAQNLVHQELHVVVGQPLRADDVVQIGAHQVRHHVHLLKVLLPVAVRMEHVQQSDDVLVVHVLQQAQLAVGALRVHGRLERARQLLDGHFDVVGGVEGGTVCVGD